VAFLFSDIEGSTVRWERDRAVMATALSRHDELMRAALEARGAYIFKTVGDAFCAAFATTPDAIEAALEAQRAFAAEDFSAVEGLRVRMALHAGRSTERDGDYFGPAVNRVARLLAIGHGGQVLVSGTAADLLQGEMPSQCTLSDLGAHRLKDLAQPERVYQLVAPDLPETFPALRSLGYFANNLPAQLTSFVGREDVVSEIVALFEKHRLVTLVGTGGAGKTRCAIQVGAELLDRFGDGVWLAEFAPVSDSSLLASVVAQALSVQEHPNRPLLNTLTAYLKRKRLLLLFDNCEHVIGEAPAVATALLQACPDVRILATSREGLNVAGEQRYHMPSLSVPPADRALSALDALAFGAPLLFADRAISVDNRFAITDENVAYVAEICRRLDGIPLAIELAAARVKLLAPQRIAQMLDERFRVLTGGDRSALPRHQTMRALIDWSYDLLSEQERALFRKLSIFAGGFTLESAVATCRDAAMDEITVFDALSSLVDKSLVHAEPTEDGTRYRLLESTRQYARERLDESGEYDAIARAHGAAFLAFAEELDRTWESELDRVWIARAQPELENFRVALAWAFGPKGDAFLGQRLTGMLSQVWTSHANEGGPSCGRTGPAPVPRACRAVAERLRSAHRRRRTRAPRADRRGGSSAHRRPRASPGFGLTQVNVHRVVGFGGRAQRCRRFGRRATPLRRVARHGEDHRCGPACGDDRRKSRRSGVSRRRAGGRAGKGGRGERRLSRVQRYGWHRDRYL
jgi:predicted ATPase/class 3 adenylate cyclase